MKNAMRLPIDGIHTSQSAYICDVYSVYYTAYNDVNVTNAYTHRVYINEHCKAMK